MHYYAALPLLSLVSLNGQALRKGVRKHRATSRSLHFLPSFYGQHKCRVQADANCILLEAHVGAHTAFPDPFAAIWLLQLTIQRQTMTMQETIRTLSMFENRVELFDISLSRSRLESLVFLYSHIAACIVW